MIDQRSLIEQMITLHRIANLAGLYDAADAIYRDYIACE